MRRILGATVMLGLVAWSAVSVEAAELNGPRDGVGNEIVVVNHSVTPVRVYVEDSEGGQHELGRVARGQIKIFYAPADISERGQFRVRVHPRHYYQNASDQVRIKTRALHVEDDQTVILWLRRELSQSKVEVRQG